jgi:hypothetical protein
LEGRKEGRKDRKKEERKKGRRKEEVVANVSCFISLDLSCERTGGKLPLDSEVNLFCIIASQHYKVKGNQNCIYLLIFWWY